jgi:DNA-binding CsgD family transcriptional regulator
MLEAAISDARARGLDRPIGIAHWLTAVMYNGLARYEHALSAAQRALSYEDLGFSGLALTELVEAAARTEDREVASDALRQLAERTRASGTEWALGIEARSRALLSDSDEAERLYREAIERLERTRVRVEDARGHLLYGEWLRRERRRVDARKQLRTADEMFTAMGAEAFAARAERELRATGERVRKRTVETRDDLTAQEAQIARLARDGLSNPEIGTRLFISPRTVEYHLHKIFTKLGIGSRFELDRSLPDDQNQRVSIEAHA